MTFYFVSPLNATSPGLFETFPETFIANGHSITQNINEAECVFFDMHSGYLPYNWGELRISLDKKLPIAIFDAHDYHCDSNKNWYWNYSSISKTIISDWGRFLYEARFNGNKVVYFMRKIQINNDLPDWIYPLELCQFPDHDFPLTTKEELTSRPYDACFIGAESPRRREFIDALQKDGRLKLDIQFTTERIPHDEWLDRHRKAKLFIEADGGGLGSERPYQLMTIAPMLKQHNLQLINNDWVADKDCIKMGEFGFSTIEISWVLATLLSTNHFYNIYLKGNERMKKYFSWEYRANYVLGILKQNGIC